MVNYFELMDLPIKFNLDSNQLDTMFRQLQSAYHPDVAKTTLTEKDTVYKTLSLANLTDEQASAVINTAYQTLKNPDSRATHLLKLARQADNLNDSIRELDFLDKAMALRISLEEAQINELVPLQKALQDWLHDVEQDFNAAYQNQDWQNAHTATQQLKFLIKLQNDFAKKTDELMNQSQINDDDLYI